ncbi:MAG: GNAT family N-acetyltransferase [Actinobacteria bacterium]|nr:GNAT family N-acetyltransferase [Actinomycetota bacterium]
MRERLTDPALAQILDFCAEEPVERVFLEDVARRRLGRFTALERRGRLTALCHVGANVVPSGSGCAAFADVVLRGRARMFIGAERSVDELWDACASSLPEPREDRPGQPVYELREAPERGGTALREATLDDLDLLLPACAAAHEEELGVDPLARDPTAFRWRTRSQIDERRSWLWVEGTTILFKAEASAWTPDAVQLQQVWCDPDARGRGYARRALSDLCTLLLERVPAVCLFVRRENERALRLYEAVGMRRAGTYRSILL